MYTFFFSSRRRHTSSKRDWSSDVCSSDLPSRCRRAPRSGTTICGASTRRCRNGGRSEERRVGKSVDLGGRRIVKKKNKQWEEIGQSWRRVSCLTNQTCRRPAER